MFEQIFKVPIVTHHSILSSVPILASYSENSVE